MLWYCQFLELNDKMVTDIFNLFSCRRSELYCVVKSLAYGKQSSEVLVRNVGKELQNIKEKITYFTLARWQKFWNDEIIWYVCPWQFAYLHIQVLRKYLYCLMASQERTTFWQEKYSNFLHSSSHVDDWFLYIKWNLNQDDVISLIVRKI